MTRSLALENTEASGDDAGIDDWHAAYVLLEREHFALRQRYESDMKLWLEFKRWWLTVVATGSDDELCIVGDSPVASDAREMAEMAGATHIASERSSRLLLPATSASMSDTPKAQQLQSMHSQHAASTGAGESAGESAGTRQAPAMIPPQAESAVQEPLTPRKRVRQSIREHRASVRARLQSDPNAFKKHGRYAFPARTAPRSADAHIETYYAAVGSPPPRARAIWDASSPSSQDSPSKNAKTRKARISRHRTTAPPDPTPPDYWSRRLSGAPTEVVEEDDRRKRQKVEESDGPQDVVSDAISDSGADVKSEAVPPAARPQQRKKRASQPPRRTGTSIPQRAPSLYDLPDHELEKLTPAERAARLLHVSATPDTMPCRQNEFQEVLEFTSDALAAGAGGCAYICGVPGTGKTATVRAAMRELAARMEQGRVPHFDYCEINGMKLASASQAYIELWYAIGGRRLNSRNALKHLSAYFGAGEGADRQPLVVLMDELDMFVTSRQDVIYNLFHWPNLPGSNLVVIAVANTMDLPERTLQPKVASRLGMTRIPFMPYTDRQLLEIVHMRLGSGDDAVTKGCPDVFSQDALVFAAKRVANVSGDARRMLDVCRRAADSAEGQISIADIRHVLDSMARSGKGVHIAALPLHAKLLLASMFGCVRQTSLDEISWGDVVAHHTVLVRTHAFASTSAEALLRPLAALCALGLVIAVGAGAGPGRAGSHARLLLER
ncbi:Origin recognition complex, subunit 1 [Malassezia cuniculi]|uniref:Origin recognition complex subunit 1 n=1 Tax=Malassezia cuniculi TaxID=948313 RepID=A0AAF0ESW9_9BASI|nr:Origin recognition complex, subunit 1 [Malassezia cuniculi]